MSQGTPSRGKYSVCASQFRQANFKTEGRIERHLMRQRGAGVRAIKVDFGFSFALPLAPSIAHSIAELDPPEEPPAKRCRTNGPATPKRRGDDISEGRRREDPYPTEAVEQPDSGRITVKDHNKHTPTIHRDKGTATIGVISTEQAPKTRKKAPRARRKSCLDDELDALEVKQNNGEVRTGGLEDTFIFGFTPKKRQPKLKTEEGAVTDEPQHKKKPKATRKKTMASKSTAAIAKEVNDAIEPPIDSGVDHASDDSGGIFTAAEDLAEESVKRKAKTVKAKPAPKKAPKRSVDEVATAVESMNTATPERPTKRPRRQAAISAIKKVTMGYEDELIPVDKLRRAPEAESKRGRSRKVDVLRSAETALLSPPLTTQADPSTRNVRGCDESNPPASPALVVKRVRKPGVKIGKGRTRAVDEQPQVVESLQAKHPSPTREDNHATADEPPPAPKPPARRGRKAGVKITKGLTDVADEKQEILQPQSAEHMSPTKEDGHVPDDEQSLPCKLPAKRGRKPGSTNRTVVAATDHEDPSVAPAVTELASNRLSSASKNNYTPDDEPVHSPKLPTKRGLKPGSKNRKVLSAITQEELTVGSTVTGLTPHHSLPAETNERKPDDEPPLSPKLPAKRGRKPGTKNRKVDAATIHMELAAGPTTGPSAGPTAESIAGPTAGPTAGLLVPQLAPKEETSPATESKNSTDTDSKAQATKVLRHGTKGGTERPRKSSEDARSTNPSQEAASVRSRPLEKQSSRESARKTVEDQATKQRRVLADFDGNIVKRSSAEQGKRFMPSTVESVSPLTKQQSKPRKTKKELAVQLDHRLAVIRGALRQHSPNEGPFHETTTTPKKRHVISTEEDLDWLFEKPQSRRPKPATVRQPGTKTRRIAADQSAKEMDLDDLIATVDGLAAGELLTGRRGRVVAS